MSRRSRTRRDKRAPIPGFDDPQPRMPGLFHLWSTDVLWICLQRHRGSERGLAPVGLEGRMAGRD